MTYQLAAGVRLECSPRGNLLVSERPLRLVRLSPPLFRLLQRHQGEAIEARSAAETRVLESLVKSGFLTRQRQSPDDLAQLPSVSVIIPVKDRADDLRNCLNSLRQLDYPPERIEVIVVDDGSRDGTPAVARELGATLISSGSVAGGPALARNRGAAIATGEILAFIDSDCTASQAWLTELVPAFSDPKLAAVGGWVAGMHHGSGLDRYEAVMSSLNLGRREMAAGSGGDTFYLPSCNLLLRKSAFSLAGGFRSELQVGEDVDLTWRLRDAGWKILYRPEGSVCHAHRSLVWPFMRRRFDYGTSEGRLQQLHPVRGKKILLPPMLTAMLLCMVLAVVTRSLLPLSLAVCLAALDTWQTRRRVASSGLTLSPGRILVARLRAVGSLGYYLGYHLLRYYLLPQLLVALFYPAFALLPLTLWLGVGLVDYRVRRPRLSLVEFYLYYVLEQLAYGCGVFWGCCKAHSFSSYRLDLSRA